MSSGVDSSYEIDHSAFLERISQYVALASRGVSLEEAPDMPFTRKSLQRSANAADGGGGDDGGPRSTLKRADTDPDYEEEIVLGPATRAQAARPSRKGRIDAEIRDNSKYVSGIIDSDDHVGAAEDRSPSPPVSPENAITDEAFTKNGEPPLRPAGLQASRPQGPPAKKPRLTNDHPPTFARPDMHEKDLQNDLVDFGFSNKQVKDMLSKKEPHWDPATPTHLMVDQKATQATREKRERTKKRNSGAEEQYKPLFLREGSAWALFDPNLGYPPDFKNPPHLSDKFAAFKTGNKRILEYNIKTQSVRIRSTPAILKTPGKGVDYTKTGPKIIDEASAVVVKRKRGRPRRFPPLADSCANASAKTDVVTRVSERKGALAGKTRAPRMLVRRLSSSSTSDDSELTDLELEGEGVSEDVGEEIEVKLEGC